MNLFSIFCFIIFLSFSHANVVFADNHNNYRIKNSQQAAQVVKARIGGKVLKVNKSKTKGQIYYRVKVVKKDGHVVSVLVNAKTGKVTRN